MKKTILLIAIAFLFSGCQKHTPSNKVEAALAAGIVNGQIVSADSSIQLLAVQILTPKVKNPNDTTDSVDYGACTGTLIADDMVLTAAHCFNDADPKKNSLVIFERNTTSALITLKRITVSKVIIHKDYKAAPSVVALTAGFYQNVNDMALLKLSASAPTDYVRLRLPPDQLMASDTGVKMVAIGYGRVTGKENAQGLSGILRYKKDLTTKSFTQNSSYFILDQSDGGVCSGDSGGPALYLDEERKIYALGVASIVSYSDSFVNQGGDPCKSTSIYTKVGFYKSWIKETARVNGSAL